MMKKPCSALIALLLVACPGEPDPVNGGPAGHILNLQEADVPGVFEVTGSPGPFSYDCNEGSGGDALVVNAHWLAPRDLPDLQAECRLVAEGVEPSPYVQIRPGQLEAQRQRIDPRGDGGLGPWEARAVDGTLAELLADPALAALAWNDEAGQLQVFSATGHLQVERVWAAGVATFRTQVVEGEDPCLALEIEHCIDRLMAFFESPDAPDALILPHPEAQADGMLGRASGWQRGQARVPLIVWGQGQGSSGLGSAEGVDLALAVARSLGRKTGLGYGPDGALGEVYLPRQDGAVVEGLLPEASDRVVVIVIEGLSQATWGSQRAQLPGLSRLAQEGVESSEGLLGSLTGEATPAFASLITGARGAHHGLIGDRYWTRSEKRVQDLAMGVSGDLEGIQGALLRRPSQSLFALLGGPDRWMVALGSSPCLEVESCTATGRGPAANKWRRIPEEAAYAALPQPPEWSVAESSGDWEDSVIMTEYARRLVLGLGHPQRPYLMVAGIPGYRRMAERYGPESSQASEMLGAIDGLLNQLIDEMVTRQLNEQVTVVVTSDAPVIQSDPQRPLPAWWVEGMLHPGIRAINGQLYVDALAMERQVDNGFVTLEITDADAPGDPLNSVSVTLYSGADEEVAQHFPSADGTITFASPNDRETYAVARVEGFAALRISNTELRR